MVSAASASASPAAIVFRILALGSSTAVALHLSPIVIHAKAPQSVTLCACEEPLLSRTGLSRVARQARSGSAGRVALLDAGVLAALERCAASEHSSVRQAAQDALLDLLREDRAVEEVMRIRALREALSRLRGEPAVTAWTRVAEVDAARMQVRPCGVCEWSLDDAVRIVLRDAGVCPADVSATANPP